MAARVSLMLTVECGASCVPTEILYSYFTYNSGDVLTPGRNRESQALNPLHIKSRDDALSFAHKNEN